MTQYFNPLLCGDFYRAFNFLNLPTKPSYLEVWKAAQQTTNYFSSFCKDEGLPVDAVRCFFGVSQSCASHDEAAAIGAANITKAFFEHSQEVCHEQC